jgi:hypothetical protein
MSVTIYSIYSQLPPIFGVCLLHLQSKDAPCYDDRDPLNISYDNLVVMLAQILFTGANFADLSLYIYLGIFILNSIVILYIACY